jgi:hypothetical protein
MQKMQSLTVTATTTMVTHCALSVLVVPLAAGVVRVAIVEVVVVTEAVDMAAVVDMVVAAMVVQVDIVEALDGLMIEEIVAAAEAVHHRAVARTTEYLSQVFQHLVVGRILKTTCGKPGMSAMQT